MIANDTYRGDLIAAASGSVPGLVIQLQTELHSLLMRNKEIGWRINNIRRVMRGLQEIAATPAIDHLCTTPHTSPVDRIIASGFARNRADGSRRKSNGVTGSLQRACRIALMEGATPASLEEIYSRIVRRGSFLFVNPQRANSSLRRVLWAMAEDGEIRLLKVGSCSRWERIALIEDQSTRLPNHPLSALQAGMQYPAQQVKLANELG
jgi:hypothetical protein